MIRGRLAILVVMALLLGLSAVLSYRLFDAAVSLDYARQQQKADRERTRLLRAVLRHTVKPWTRADLVRTIEQNFAKDHIIKKSDDRVELDGVSFVFSGERVADVLFIEEELTTGGAPHR